MSALTSLPLLIPRTLPVPSQSPQLPALSRRPHLVEPLGDVGVLEDLLVHQLLIGQLAALGRHRHHALQVGGQVVGRDVGVDDEVEQLVHRHRGHLQSGEVVCRRQTHKHTDRSAVSHGETQQPVESTHILSSPKVRLSRGIPLSHSPCIE